MADVSDIAEVRENVNEPMADTYSDEAIGALVDSFGIAGASARIWRAKAARYVTLVDVTESGSSHKYSDLHKNALAMAKAFDAADVIEDAPPVSDRVHVKRIVRS